MTRSAIDGSFEQLTPTAFLDRAVAAHGERLAVVDGDERWTYAEFADRCARLASGLAHLAGGRTVGVLAPNSHMMLECHFGIPLAGSVMVPVNIRLSAPEIAYILTHAEVAVLIYDTALQQLVDSAVKLCGAKISTIVSTDYESLVDTSPALPTRVADERSLLSINYTSGTTGRPKGVMYQHRGAYLQALAMVGHMGLSPRTVHLWTLPMFHCHGWCFPWAVTAAGGTHVCLRHIDATRIWRLIDEEGVTHFNAAPTVLTMLAYVEEAKSGVEHRVIRVATGGAPPSPALLRRMSDLGFDITHLYGLTETYGPAVICDWRPEWDGFDQGGQALIKARQGVGNMVTSGVRVIDSTGCDVVRNGSAVGEIVLRGNNVMLGYYNEPDATAAAIPDGWLRTGDLAVMHDDGYIEIKDRSKDVIISGGENIASVEIEQVLAEHPKVLEAVVVAAPDGRWGEVPVAFVNLHAGMAATQKEIVGFVRDRIASFKAPKRVYFGELPKTGTGKVRKYELRDRAKLWCEKPE